MGVWRSLVLVAAILAVTAGSLGQSAAYESARDAGDSSFADGRYAPAIDAFERMLAAAADDRQRLAAHWRLARAAAEAGQPELGLRAVRAMIEIDRSLADDAEVRATQRRLEALPRAAESAEADDRRSGSNVGLPAEALIAVRAAQQDLRDAMEGQDAGSRARAGEVALERLWPLLVDLSLPEDPQLWQTAGWAAVYASREDLAPLLAAMVKRTAGDLAADDRSLTLAAELLRMTTARAIEQQGEHREDVLEWHARVNVTGTQDSDSPAGAMNNIGVRFVRGHGVPQDDAQAVLWYQRAARGGDRWAMSNLGWMHANGRGVPEDLSEAAAWYRKSADLGHATAARRLGLMHEYGRGVELDLERAVSLYRMAAEAGDALSMKYLGYMHEAGRGVERDLERAVMWYRKAAEGGSAAGMHNLALLHEEGHGVDRDGRAAADLYERAAIAGHRESMFRLGLLLDLGELVKEDNPHAISWYRRAADEGHVQAGFNIGLIYEFGEPGVGVDLARAREAYQAAARGGHARAMTNLAFLLDEGKGGPEDNAQAAVWYRKAADLGNTRAMNNLAVLMADGEGVPKDEDGAIRLWRRAAREGNETAQKNLRRRLLDW